MSVLFSHAVVWLDLHLMVIHYGDQLLCRFHLFWKESGVSSVGAVLPLGVFANIQLSQ